MTQHISEDLLCHISSYFFASIWSGGILLYPRPFSLSRWSGQKYHRWPNMWQYLASHLYLYEKLSPILVYLDCMIPFSFFLNTANQIYKIKSEMKPKMTHELSRICKCVKFCFMVQIEFHYWPSRWPLLWQIHPLSPYFAP